VHYTLRRRSSEFEELTETVRRFDLTFTRLEPGLSEGILLEVKSGDVSGAGFIPPKELKIISGSFLPAAAGGKSACFRPFLDPRYISRL
jgi:hypothetical protein